jgi:predicted glutamine amidotransferase
MCRLMTVKSTVQVSPRPFMEKFAFMAKESKSYDGDWQGDGWGIGCLISAKMKPHWRLQKSTLPIWQEKDRFSVLPASNMFVAHARSASFPEHKGKLEYSQPFIDESFAFVFNGLINGVSLPFKVNGDIGSQKIWSILSYFLKRFSPRTSLDRLIGLLKRHARSIQAVNIAICDRNHIYLYSHPSHHPEYYTLHCHTSPSLQIVSSEPIGGFDFKPVPTGESIVI